MTEYTQDAKVTNYEWCNQELANKKSDGIHLIITRRGKVQYAAWSFFFYYFWKKDVLLSHHTEPCRKT